MIDSSPLAVRPAWGTGGGEGSAMGGQAAPGLPFVFAQMASEIEPPDLSPLVPSPGQASLEVRVNGRVQGVGFRYFTLEVARSLGITGYVMNTRDGGVRAYAEGPRESLKHFLCALQQGPGGARVQGVRATWGTATGAQTTFIIQPTR